MGKAIKYLSNIFLRPLVAAYLSRERVYRYSGLRLRIPPQVFHPAFFFSTRLLIAFVDKMDIRHSRLLELGAGSGLISLWAARKGARVTATDISTIAVNYLYQNSKTNRLHLTIHLSDLFKDIPPQLFDIIVINPPYFKKDPVSPYDHAWYCGKNGAYFAALFATLSPYIHTETQVIMILSGECDINMIQGYAAENNFVMQLQQTKRKYWETNFIYYIVPR